MFLTVDVATRRVAATETKRLPTLSSSTGKLVYNVVFSQSYTMMHLTFYTNFIVLTTARNNTFL